MRTDMDDRSAKVRTVILCNDSRIDRRVLDQARSVSLSGFDVTLVAGSAPSGIDNLTEREYGEFETVRISDYSSNVLSEKIHLETVRSALDTLPGYEWALIFPEFIHFLLEAVSRPARLYVACDLPMLAPALIAASVNNGRVLYDAHEFYPHQFEDPNKVKLLLDIEAALIARADVTVTVNESIADEMGAFYKIKRPHVVLNLPGISGLKTPFERTDILRRSLSIPAERKILLYQGNISRGTRNLEPLAQAACELQRDDFALVYLGEDHRGIDPIVEIARRYNSFRSRIFIHSSVPQTSLLRYSASADAGIIPYLGRDLNTRLCTPNKLFEFIVAGLPMLGSDLPELNRFISGNRIGINRNLESVESIKAALNEFLDLDLSSLRDSVGTLSPKYTWESQSDQVVSLYKKALCAE